MIFKTKYEDENLMPGCYEWLRNWKSAPTNIIRDIYDLYCQTLKTKCFEITRVNCHLSIQYADYVNMETRQYTTY